MFMIDYKKPSLASFLGMERPKKIRVKVTLEKGCTYYTPQAKWFFKWHDNNYKTRSVKTLMWQIYGPNASEGRRIEDIDLIGMTRKSVSETVRERARQLDFFPFNPTKKDKI